MLFKLGLQDRFAFRFAVRMNVHLGLDDRDQTGGAHGFSDGELLRHNRRDAFGAGGLDDRPLLGAKDTSDFRARQQISKLGHGFKQLHAVCFVFQTFVDLEEGHDAAVFPQQLCHGFAVDRIVHRALEQDRAQNFIRGEIIGQNDPRAHVVHGLKHLGVAGIIRRFNAIEA